MPKKRSVKGGSMNQSSQPLSSQTPNQVMVQGGPKPSVPKPPPNPISQSSKVSQSNPMSQSNPEESSMFSSFTNMFDTSTMDTKQILMYLGLFIVGIALTYALYSVLSSNNSSSNNSSSNSSRKEDEENNGKQDTAAKMVESVVTAAVNASVNNSTGQGSSSTDSSSSSTDSSTSSTGSSSSSTGSGLSASASTTESFINYLVNTIFEPGRPDINEIDSNKLLPGYFNVGIEYNEKV